MRVHHYYIDVAAKAGEAGSIHETVTNFLKPFPDGAYRLEVTAYKTGDTVKFEPAILTQGLVNESWT